MPFGLVCDGAVRGFEIDSFFHPSPNRSIAHPNPYCYFVDHATRPGDISRLQYRVESSQSGQILVAEFYSNLNIRDASLSILGDLRFR